MESAERHHRIVVEDCAHAHTVTITHTQELLFHAADRQPADNVFLQHQIDYRNRQCHQQRHGCKFVKIVQASLNGDMEV